MLKWQTVVVAYTLLGLVAWGLSAAFGDGNPWSFASPWMALDEPLRTGTSFLLGLALAALLVASTRVAVQRFSFAQQLHSDLRPVARDLTLASVLLIAMLSSVGEELLFRGFLTPRIGVFAQALIFGMAHQVRGPSRWVWVGWASLVGVCFGFLFLLTGSLAGPIVAHAAVNAYNLIFLRNHDPLRKDRRLGGLLAPSDV
ncbi:MAG TPA: CPBP family intramembrane glutamic endopeptidase [Polyangiaceae bacterium]|nr:CPBP family intramembrane glutamic endopeptidase [Polyangiaceae bacterium]